MTFTLQLGIDERQRDTAARLYWEAFGSKLGRVMGPEAKALAYLNRVIRCDHAVAALQDGQLIGLAGFKSPLGGFADGGWHDMRAVYGTLGAVWRLALLMAVSLAAGAALAGSTRSLRTALSMAESRPVGMPSAASTSMVSRKAAQCVRIGRSGLLTSASRAL